MTIPIGSTAMSSTAFGQGVESTRAPAWSRGDATLVSPEQVRHACTPISQRVASIPNEPPLARLASGKDGLIEQWRDACGCVMATEPSFSDVADKWAAMATLDAVASLLEQAFSDD